MQLWKFDLGSKRITRETTPASATAAHTDLRSDTLYLASGAQIVPMHTGVLATGKWRSRELKLPSGKYYGFAWVRVNGDFAEGATVKLFAEGALVYTTPTITNGTPQRLPAGKARAWSIEIESKDRVTSLVVAGTAEELV